MQTILHVNQHIIRYNTKWGTAFATIIVRQGNRNRYAQEVIIHGPSHLRHRAHEPLDGCGARVWQVTDAHIELIGETTFAQIVYEMKQHARRMVG